MDVYAAISDPSRRAILDLLLEGDRAAHELLGAFRFSQPALSKHLRVLREHGLVSMRKRGREHLYHLEARQLREVSQWVAHYERFWNEKLDRLGNLLEDMP
ncbi:MAG: winged helix-turn-helix transcriptional regulator [Planctomycetes bacterium]|nr:winged helix-turn-helix transcriptional regulator [Planctomycetota bacterium]